MAQQVATVPVPTDHLRKKPRRVVVGVYLDDDLAVAHEQAVAALERAKLVAESDRARRVADGKSRAGADLPTVPVEERVRLAIEVADRVAAEIDAELAPLRDAEAAALTALDAGTVWFTFRALGRKKWRALVKAHPPTDTDHAELVEQTGNENARAPWDAEGLAPELLQASCIRRVIDGNDLGPLTGADLDAIFGTADDVADDDDAVGAWNDTEVQALFVTALNAQMQARAVQHRPAPVGGVQT